MNNNWYKKEKPLLGLTGLGGGVDGLAVVGAAAKTYVDDVFSTYLWIGDGNSGRTITNNIDVSGEGGLVWMKSRSTGHVNVLFDTERGANQRLRSDSNLGQNNTDTLQPSFTNSGFTVGSGNEVNGSGNEYTSWTWRKQKGFFDVVTWTGTGSYRTLDHSLGCIPGFIMLKQTSGTENWICWHRYMGSGSNPHYLKLNSNAAMGTDGGGGSNPNASVNSVSSTQFTVGADNNGSGGTWVAYLFAGGESDAATARSVDFDGTGDYLNTTSSSSDFTMGTGDFTVECWVKKDNITNAQGIFQISSTSGGLEGDPNYASTIAAAYGSHWHTYGAGNYNTDSSQTPARKGQWQHVAYVRHSGTSKFYVDGEELISYTDTTNYNGTYIAIGGYYSTTYLMDGKISNFRVVKGTAVYTSAFRPPTKPLTNISGTVLLCCNNSSITGSTVTPVTLNSNGDPTASTDSPFDDPNAFKFGEDREGIVKCGSYIGNGSTTGPEISLGFEPQWLLIRGVDGGDWNIIDCMRGIVTGDNDNRLWANLNSAQSTSLDVVDITSTGFKITHDGSSFNSNGSDMIYMAIRRPDGYVGKPPSAGTGVFAMDTGNSSSTVPAFDTTFNVGFALARAFGSTDNWYAVSRLTQGHPLFTNANSSEDTQSWAAFDASNGWGTGFGSSQQSWMWKRGQGFDVSTYKATGGALSVAHGLSQVPEMYWIKNRDDSKPWIIYHKDLNGGTNPNQYYLQFDTDGEATISPYADAPTATHFNIAASESWTNDTGDEYITMLFASANDINGSPISKVGSYSGSGGAQTITTGFQPRFVIIKRTDGAASWFVFDTVRGWSSGADPYLLLDSTAAQDGAYDMGSSESNGFSLINDSNTNASGGSYIYYAHA